MSWLTSEASIQRYIDALRRATQDDSQFSCFRRAPGVREIVEGIPDVVGHGYYQKLIEHLGEAELANVWQSMVRNDSVGDPSKVRFTLGEAASTTMRYAWNVFHMRKNDVVLDEADIYEVGGGYGGLCRMVHQFSKPKSYTIVDIPEALELAKKYLNFFGIVANFVSCEEVREVDACTFISNYALTELTRDQQKVYVDNLIKKSRSGYITHNSQPRNENQQYTLKDLVSHVTGTVTVEPENIKKSECTVLIWR